MHIVKLFRDTIIYEIRNDIICQDIISSNGWIVDRYLLDKYFGPSVIFVKQFTGLLDMDSLEFTYNMIMANPHLYNNSKYHLDILFEELTYHRYLLNLVQNYPNNLHYICLNNWTIIDRYIETEMKKSTVEYKSKEITKLMSRIAEYWERDHVYFINNEVTNLYNNLQSIINSIELLTRRSVL